MSWNEGYVSGIDYESVFFNAQAPSYLHFCCLMHGVEPVPFHKPLSYLELGCGHAFTSTLLAAANPHSRFWAVDFMPVHIAGAKRLADAARLNNLELLENSFAELISGAGPELPQFDIITLYGVYAWVSRENREHILGLVRKHLKPGGVLYVNYNAMPGWSTVLPMQHLLLNHVNQATGPLNTRIAEALQLAQEMRAAQAGYFVSNAGSSPLTSALEIAIGSDPNYVAHEYLNRDWQPLYHADVARDFSSVKLDYAGTACLVASLQPEKLPEAQRKILEATADPVLQQTLLDYFFNTQFRQDIYIRGIRRLNKVELVDRMKELALALSPKHVKSAASALKQAPEQHQKIMLKMLESLQDGPQTLYALMKKIDLGSTKELFAIAASLMICAEISPCHPEPAAVDPEPARRLNAVIAKESEANDKYQALASPLLGNGVAASLYQRLAYRSLSSGHQDLQATQIAREIYETLTALGTPVLGANNEIVDDETSALRVLTEFVEDIQRLRVPVWRNLQII